MTVSDQATAGRRSSPQGKPSWGGPPPPPGGAAGGGGARGVVVARHQVAGADRVAEDGLVPVDHSLDGASVGVEQQLGGVEAQAAPRVEGAVDAEPVALVRHDARHVAVPGVGGDLGQLEPALGAALVEEAQLDGLRLLGEDREIRALSVPGGAERPRPAGPHRLVGGIHGGVAPHGLLMVW